MLLATSYGLTMHDMYMNLISCVCYGKVSYLWRACDFLHAVFTFLAC